MQLYRESSDECHSIADSLSTCESVVVSVHANEDVCGPALEEKSKDSVEKDNLSVEGSRKMTFRSVAGSNAGGGRSTESMSTHVSS